MQRQEDTMQQQQTPATNDTHTTKRSPSAEDASLSSGDVDDGNTVTSSTASTTVNPCCQASPCDDRMNTPPPAPHPAGATGVEQQQAEQQAYYDYSQHHHQHQQQQYYPNVEQQQQEYASYNPYYHDQHQQEWYSPADYQQHQQQQEPTPQLLCYGCGTKSVVFGSEFCSRRCSWLCNNQCPQCGKHKMSDNGFLYCSRHCSNQSAQANWCSYCAVCQNSITGSCSNMQCRGSSAPSSSSSVALVQQGYSNNYHSNGGGYGNGQGMMNMMPTVVPQLALGGKGGNYKYHSKMECRLMNSSDISRSGLPTVFNSLFANGLGSRIVTAVKLTACAQQRKRYLSYRSVVENQMSAIGAPKYGHGGEGNEQRRYFGLPLRCSLGATSSSPVPPSAIGAGRDYMDHHQQAMSLRTCQDPGCHVCQVMAKGFDMSNFSTASHYCSTTVTAASQYLDASPKTNLRAIVVARVVIGNAEVHVLDGARPAPMVQPPQDPSTNHSLIFTTNHGNDTSFDGTYVFSDEAVDPQYLVLFE